MHQNGGSYVTANQYYRSTEKQRIERCRKRIRHRYKTESEEDMLFITEDGRTLEGTPVGADVESAFHEIGEMLKSSHLIPYMLEKDRNLFLASLFAKFDIKEKPCIAIDEEAELEDIEDHPVSPVAYVPVVVDDKEL